MKKLAKLSLIVFVPLILGLVVNVIGGQSGNESAVKAGILILKIGVPVTMFVLVVVGLILMITGRLTEDKNGVGGSTDADVKPATPTGEDLEKGETAAEKEEEKIEDINSSVGYESQLKAAEYQMEHVAENYRNSSRADKIKGWLFGGFLITDFALIMLFIFLQIPTGIFICLGIFAGTILISIIVVTILQKRGMTLSRRKGVEYVGCKGVVKACLLSSMSTRGGASRHSTTRVTNVVYRVIIDVDGREYTTYGRQFYDVGEKLDVTVRKDGKGTAVIEHKTPEEEAAERKAFAEEAEEDLKRKEEHIRELEREIAQRTNGDGEEDNKQ